MRGEGGVVGEGRVFGAPKFHSGISAPCHQQISTKIGRPMLPLACVLYWFINVKSYRMCCQLQANNTLVTQ